MRYSAFLRDMNVGVRAPDERVIEVLAQDLPCFGGAQLAIDIKLRCALSRLWKMSPLVRLMSMVPCWCALGWTKRPCT